ncbi:hypothetical protein D3C80_2049450 [compost metagenome]
MQQAIRPAKAQPAVVAAVAVVVVVVVVVPRTPQAVTCWVMTWTTAMMPRAKTTTAILSSRLHRLR